MSEDSIQAYTAEERIVDLRERGLAIPDFEQASLHIQQIGQHRLKQYWHHLQDKETRLFEPGHDFPEVIELYYKDRELRQLFQLPIELIELTLRRAIEYAVLKLGNTYSIYEPGFLSQTSSSQDLAKELHFAVLKNKKNYDFLTYFENKAYPDLVKLDEEARRKELENHDLYRYPIHLMVEAISLTNLSKIFSSMSLEGRKIVTTKFPEWNEGALVPFIKRMSVLRNIVAHYGLVWRRSFVWGGPMPAFYKKNFIPPNTSLDSYQGKSVFDILSLLLDLVPKLQPGNLDWNEDVINFVSGLDRRVLQRMGFPGNWIEYEYWSKKKPAWTPPY